MLRLCANVLLFSVLVSRGYSSYVKVTGELSFDIKISDLEQRAVEGDVKAATNTTAATAAECLYQYPDEEQFNAMLSNMMNALTKVFVRVHEEMRRQEDGRRRHESRFRVVDRIGTAFFENIYSNMTQEYTQFYNSSSQRVARNAGDPCENQQALRNVWRSLLESSLASLHKAASRCIEEFLQARNDSKKSHRIRYKLGQFVLREMARARATQLRTLCDRFQLCFSELLR